LPPSHKALLGGHAKIRLGRKERGKLLLGLHLGGRKVQDKNQRGSTPQKNKTPKSKRNIKLADRQQTYIWKGGLKGEKKGHPFIRGKPALVEKKIGSGKKKHIRRSNLTKKRP